MSNRRVLLVCYYFPPLGMGGIGRPLNLFEELPKFGWDCHILTVKGVAYRGYERELAQSLDQTRIHRAGSFDPQRLLYLFGVRKVAGSTIEKSRAVSSKFFPDSKVGWVGPAARMALKLCGDHKFDVVMTTSPPISCHLVGQQLMRDYDIPWVADFRDYWTVEPVEKTYDTASFIDRGNQLKDQIRAQATALTAVNESIGSYMGADEVIRNAYNESQAAMWTAPPVSTHFSIGVVGHQSGSTIWDPLLDVIAAAREIEPSIDQSIDLVQIGQVDQSTFEHSLQQRSLRCRLSGHGMVSRRRALELLNGSHLIYIGLPDTPGVEFTPGRVWDTLPSGRSILCNVSPSSEIAGILNPTGNACCFDPGRLADAVQFLVDRYNEFKKGKLVIEPRPAYAEPYGSSAMARKFVSVFERIV